MKKIVINGKDISFNDLNFFWDWSFFNLDNGLWNKLSRTDFKSEEFFNIAGRGESIV